MKEERAIPEGYMTVGQLAEKMGTTVRALQYYHTKGLLLPSAESSGGRRLYTHRDMIRLHQILSLKSLGFSLEDIKSRLIPLETPADVAAVLEQQAGAVEKEIESLTGSLQAIRALKAEVLQMQTVDFKKYADIIINLQMHNEYYWLIKHFDERTLDHIRERFDKESGLQFLERFNRLNAQALRLQKEGIPPEEDSAQELARNFWELIVEFTNGDMSLLPELMKFAHLEKEGGEWQKKQVEASAYLEPALDIYFTRLGVSPFQEGAV